MATDDSVCDAHGGARGWRALAKALPYRPHFRSVGGNGDTPLTIQTSKVLRTSNHTQGVKEKARLVNYTALSSHGWFSTVGFKWLVGWPFGMASQSWLKFLRGRFPPVNQPDRFIYSLNQRFFVSPLSLSGIVLNLFLRCSVSPSASQKWKRYNF